MSRTVRVSRIGAEGHPLAIIEAFAPDPEALRSAAAGAVWQPAGRSYPGISAPVPPGYLRDAAPLLSDVLGQVFGLRHGARVLDARFSIVTTAPELLAPAQRVPHVDAIEPGRIALVHYLAPDGADGTAFFRHRSTGHESLNAARQADYFTRLAAETAAHPPGGYITADSPLFERIALIESRFNRAILYPSALLHSGAIAPDATLSPDPLAGRLTITAFLAGQ